MGNGRLQSNQKRSYSFALLDTSTLNLDTRKSQAGFLLVNRHSIHHSKANVELKGRGGDSRLTYLPLPVGILEDGQLKQYAWDGKGIKAWDPEVLARGDNRLDRILSKLSHFRHACVEAFFPERGTVTEDYWEYIWWRAGHRLSSAMVNNFATQALLAAVGVGAKSQLPAAATINWLLKDGLGRLGRLSIAASFGQSFDSDLKRFRWLTSLIFSSSIALEFLTPLLPKHFLLLACLSNIGKSVGVTTYVATHPAFMRSFAIGDNLADINAKGQAQQMVMDTLGLALCVGLTYSVRHQPKLRLLLPLLTFPFLVSTDLLCIYQELKATHLNTLNRERAEIVAERWLLDGKTFTAKEASKQEKLLLVSQVGGGSFPLHFTTLDNAVGTPSELSELLQRHRDQKYFLAYRHQPYRQPYTGAGETLGHLAACLEHGASSESILTAVLQAAIFRRIMSPLAASVESTSPQSAQKSVKDGTAPTTGSLEIPRKVGATQSILHAQHSGQHHASGASMPGVDGVRWSLSQAGSEAGRTALEKAARLAKLAVPDFKIALERSGWQVNNIKLATKERNGFTLVAA